MREFSKQTGFTIPAIAATCIEEGWRILGPRLEAVFEMQRKGEK